MVADAKSVDTQRDQRSFLNPEDTKERISFVGSFSGQERNQFFRSNGGSAKFDEMSFCAGLDIAEDGRAVAALDFDSDGDLDLVSLGLNGLRLMMNTIDPKPANFLRLHFDDMTSSLGAEVRVWAGGRKQFARVDITSGFHTQRSLDLHFGLGKASHADRIQISWPNGRRALFNDLRGFVRVSKDAAAIPTLIPPWSLATKPKGIRGFRPTGRLETLDGKHQSILASNGTPTVVNFWAPWCAACKKEFPKLTRFARVNKGKVRVVAISLETKNMESVRKFVKKYRPGFDVLLANEKVIEAYFGKDEEIHLPSTFVFDENGILLRLFRNAIEPILITQTYRQSNPKAEDHRALAVSLMKTDKGKSAASFLRRAATSEAENGTAWWRLGVVLSRAKKYDEANVALLKAQKYSPEDPEILVDLAYVYEKQNSISRARDLLLMAIKLGRSSRAPNALGRMYEREEDLENALKYFIQASELEPYEYVILRDLRRVYAKLQDGPKVRSITSRLDELGYRPQEAPSANQEKDK